MSSPKGETDPVWTLMLTIILFMVIGYIVWYYTGEQLLYVLRYVRIAELLPFTLFDQHTASCTKWLWFAGSGEAIPSVEAMKWAQACFGAEAFVGKSALEQISIYNLSTTNTPYISDMVGQYYRWPLLGFGIACMIHALFFSVYNKFKRKHNLQSFIEAQSEMWPVISPIVKFNPTKHSARIPGDPLPDKLPLFAEGLSPEEWVSFHRVPVTNGIPERERVRRAFVHQLGPRWGGVETLPSYMLVLFAAFALKGAQQRDEAEALLGRIAKCWSKEAGLALTKEILDEAKKIARDPQVGGKAGGKASCFAYRTTSLLGVLKWARERGGVLAPAQFLWLRGVDRELWYAMNNLGRRSFHAEGAGAMAHFMAEEMAGKPLPMPRVDTAIVTLNQYLAANRVVIPPHQEKTALKG